MASVFKRGGKTNRDGQWYIAWTDHSGRRHVECAKTTDKATAERIANKKDGDAALRREGVIDASDDRFIVQARRPIAEHVADYEAALVAKGNDAEYIKRTIARTEWMLAKCNVDYISAFDSSAVDAALNDLRSTGGNAATRNTYLRSIKGLTRWLKRDRRLRSDPLSELKTVNEETDRKHTRRIPTFDEFSTLLASVEGYDHPAFNLCGTDRAMLYRIAIGTGFRANELRSLTVRSFDLKSEPATVTVVASCSKRRREDSQPIRSDLADVLRPWLACRPATERLFKLLPRGTARMLRADLAMARKNWIEAAGTSDERKRRIKSDFLRYKDANGEVFDFHASRNFYISTVVGGKVSAKVAQTLARHSTPNLTIGRYSRAHLYDLVGALDALPSMAQDSKTDEKNAMRATGTDNADASPKNNPESAQRQAQAQGAKR